MSDDGRLETLQVYRPNGNGNEYKILLLPPFDTHIDDCEKVRNWQGFNKIYRSMSASFSNDETNILELSDYVNKAGERIVELWDPFNHIVTFFIENDLHYFDFLQKFSKMRNDVFKYEYYLKRLLCENE